MNVLLYAPNVIGYIRLGLIVASVTCMNSSYITFITLMLLNMILDGVDGIVARKLNQISAFGAWLDVVVDCVSRTLVWSTASNCGWVVISLEWTTFVCTHNRGSKWKDSFAKAPWLIRVCMDRNFKTPQGCMIIAGIDGLPLWLYYIKHGGTLSTPVWQTNVSAILISFRLLAALIELWCIKTYIKHLLDEDRCEDPDNISSLKN